jgi:uncharacterized MAPEG superfamily protein
MPISITPFAGPVVVTVAYVAYYYATMIFILRTKQRLIDDYRQRGEQFDRYFGMDREMLAADRVQLNMLEHMPPFLLLLWLNAVFVSPAFATAGGAAYLLSRMVYPFVLGRRLGRGIRMLVLTATVPGYLVITAFSVALLWTLAR